ncbi:MAG: hypothetical protein WC291_00870 [Thermodesulfovibrionales bacterium]|jgi:hypothetical protein
MGTITSIIRCPICNTDKKQQIDDVSGFKDGHLLLRICDQCNNGLEQALTPYQDTQTLLNKLSEQGNPSAIGLFRHLTGKRGRHCGAYAFTGGFCLPEIRDLVLTMRKQGLPGFEILQAIRDKYPNSPDKWVSKSSLYRFFERGRQGKLKEFGVDI